MPDTFFEQFKWATYFPGYLTWWEYLGLFVVACALVGGAQLFKGHWTNRNESMPFPAAIMLWVVMFAVYFSAFAAFYKLAPEKHQTTVVVWGLVFWWLPLGYATYT